MAGMDEILGAIDQLPSLPASVVQITGMLATGTADVAEIEQVARRDEALCMTILRHANSVSYGRPGRIFNLRQSIVRLGGSALMKIVLQQKVSNLFINAGASFGLGRGALWRGALGGAIATERLAPAAGVADVDLCFVCALLRDCGKLALDTHFGPCYIERVACFLEAGCPFDQAERTAMGFDHAELGAELARRWNLPDRIASVIAAHHHPPGPGPAHDPVFDVVHMADHVSRWAGLALGFDALQHRLADHVRQSLEATARADVTRVSTRMRELEELLNLAGPQGNAA